MMGLADRDYMRDRAKRRLKGLDEMRAPGDRNQPSTKAQPDTGIAA